MESERRQTLSISLDMELCTAAAGTSAASISTLQAISTQSEILCLCTQTDDSSSLLLFGSASAMVTQFNRTFF